MEKVTYPKTNLRTAPRFPGRKVTQVKGGVTDILIQQVIGVKRLGNTTITDE